MDEKPILFSGEMVKAILDGRKTQTRRVLKKQPLDILPMKIPNEWVTLETREPEPHGRLIKCRFGIPGNRLWVRESWWNEKGLDFENAAFEDGTMISKTGGLIKMQEWSPVGSPIWKKRPSIHMPRWASRITLEIVNVRVERLQHIDEDGVLAEGITWGEFMTTKVRIGHFESLWDSINYKRGFGWDTNPFVWVIEFKKV